MADVCLAASAQNAGHNAQVTGCAMGKEIALFAILRGYQTAEPAPRAPSEEYDGPWKTAPWCRKVRPGPSSSMPRHGSK